MEKTGLIQDLEEIHSILNEAGEKYLLAGGVLLNFYREGNPNPVDGDIDIIMTFKPKQDKNYVEELSRKYKNLFSLRGFDVHISNPKPFFGSIVSLHGRVKTDIMIHEPYKENYVLGYNQFYRWYPKKMFDEPDQISIYGVNYNIPSPVEEFLFMKYRNWKIPMDTTIEKKRKLTKEEFDILKKEKVSWRGKKDLFWNKQPIFKEMIDYFNTTVYTAGCFDMLHFGHLNYLIEASKLGHKLIVGVGTDEYVRNFKGEGRPIINYKHRCFLLENLECVWKTVPHAPEFDTQVYDDENVNVLVISEDYSDTPEHKTRLKEARKRGIKIITLPRTEGISTTNLLEMKK
jgi:cytidyltransferase-like protein